MNDQIVYYQNKLNYELDPSDLFEALNKGEKIVVIDARKPNGFAEEHIPGAVNFPHRTMTIESTKDLDKNPLYVTYCVGIGCNASTRAALNLARFGFKVKELTGGIEWWKLDGYAVEGTKAKKEGLQVSCAC